MDLTSPIESDPNKGRELRQRIQVTATFIVLPIADPCSTKKGQSTALGFPFSCPSTNRPLLLRCIDIVFNYYVYPENVFIPIRAYHI